MKILVAAFCKTGTTSVEKALEILGYKVVDYCSLNVKYYDVWKNYMDGRGCLDDLRYMYAGVEVASDMPANMYWDDFTKAFPGVKLILMIREEDDWLQSWQKFWHRRNNGPLSIPLALFSPTARKFIKGFQLEGRTFFNASRQSFNKMYQGIPENVLRRVYREHNRSVIENAPPDSLLILDMKEGWRSLCEFLKKPIPDVEFPHCNRSCETQKEQHGNDPLFQQMYFEMHVAWVVIAIVMILLILCIYGIP